SNNGKARSSKAILRKGCGLRKGQIEIKANRREAPPHIATLCGIKIERRARPTLGLEQGAEQKRAKTHDNARLLRKWRDLHRRRVGIGGSEIEPEIEKRRHHALVRFPSHICHPAPTETEYR